MSIMDRIAVMGPPGSGKTTLAQQIAEITGLPIVHIDYYFLNDPKNMYDKADFIMHLEALVSQDKWVMDGEYISSDTSRLSRADLIVYLDIPRRVHFTRLLLRRVKYHKKARPGLPENWEEKLNRDFLRYAWNYKKNKRSDRLALVENAAARTVILKNNKDVKDFLDALKNES